MRRLSQCTGDHSGADFESKRRAARDKTGCVVTASKRTSFLIELRRDSVEKRLRCGGLVRIWRCCRGGRWEGFGVLAGGLQARGLSFGV